MNGHHECADIKPAADLPGVQPVRGQLMSGLGGASRVPVTMRASGSTTVLGSTNARVGEVGKRWRDKRSWLGCLIGCVSVERWHRVQMGRQFIVLTVRCGAVGRNRGVVLLVCGSPLPPVVVVKYWPTNTSRPTKATGAL